MNPDRNTIINSLKRISQLKGVLPQYDREMCSAAAEMLKEDWERLKPRTLETLFDLFETAEQ